MTDYILDSIPEAVGQSYNPVFTMAISNVRILQSEDTGIPTFPRTLASGTDVRGAYTVNLQNRLRSHWPKVLEKANRARVIHPNPVQSLVELLDSIPGDYDSWIEIVEEPYG